MGRTGRLGVFGRAGLWAVLDGLLLAASYSVGASVLTAVTLLAGMGCTAWRFQVDAGSVRWLGLALSLGLWQLGGMAWIASFLTADLSSGWQRAAGMGALVLGHWIVSLGSLLALVGAASALLGPGHCKAMALPLGWWAWALLRDVCWWGGGYGSMSLALLALPGLQNTMPLLGHSLFEPALWCGLLMLTRPGRSTISRASVAGLLAVALVFAPPASWTSPEASGLTVAAVPATEDSTEWTMERRDFALDALSKAQRAAPHGTLIVTSELYFPEPPPRSATGVWGDLLSELSARKQHLLLGTAARRLDAEHAALMNTALLLSPQEDGVMATSMYAKQRLAPVGEELPWPSLLEPIADRWLRHVRRAERQAGPVELGEPLMLNGISIDVLLCHEVAFPSQPIPAAGVLINLADDSWSNDPMAARQAVGLARLRALESGRELLRVSEGHASLLINAQGQVREVRGVERLQAHQGLTPYFRFRPLQPILLGLLVFALACQALRRVAGRRYSSTAIAPTHPCSN